MKVEASYCEGFLERNCLQQRKWMLELVIKVTKYQVAVIKKSTCSGSSTMRSVV